MNALIGITTTFHFETTQPALSGLFYANTMPKKKRTPKRYRGPAWSELELAIMRKLFPTTRTDMMARVLRRSRKSISARAHAMRLSKSPEHMQREYAQRVERCKANPFKPGQLSGRAKQNYVPVGTTAISSDGLLKKKWTDDPKLPSHKRWRTVHVLVWEAAHGPVPPGHVLAFKKGMHTTVEHEITLDKIERISRAENMQRNSYWTNLPREMAQLYHLKGQLHRRLNSLEKQRDHNS